MAAQQADALLAYRVGRAINNVRNDRLECIEPVG
jgi:putative SOS response-associated peptidase YedK